MERRRYRRYADGQHRAREQETYVKEEFGADFIVVAFRVAVRCKQCIGRT